MAGAGTAVAGAGAGVGAAGWQLASAIARRAAKLKSRGRFVMDSAWFIILLLFSSFSSGEQKNRKILRDTVWLSFTSLFFSKSMAQPGIRSPP